MNYSRTVCVSMGEYVCEGLCLSRVAAMFQLLFPVGVGASQMPGLEGCSHRAAIVLGSR